MKTQPGDARHFRFIGLPIILSLALAAAHLRADAPVAAPASTSHPTEAAIDHLVNHGLQVGAEITALLKSVVDEPSAKSAKDKVDAIIMRIAAFNDEWDKIKTTDPVVRKYIADHYDRQIAQTLSDLQTEVSRIQNDPNISDTMADAIADLRAAGMGDTEPASRPATTQPDNASSR